MDIKLLDWVIWISLVCICLFTALDSSNNLQKFKSIQNLNVEPVVVATSNDKIDVPVKVNEPVVELNSEMVIVPIGVSEEICTPETCTPTVTYSNRGIFSRWRRR